MTFRPSMKSLKAFAAAAFASAAMFGSSAQAEHIDWNFLQGSPVRFESQSSVGNQPGVQRGYQRTGAFISVFEDPSSILFIDAHGNVNYDSGNWSGDVGVGYRQDVGSAVIGGNAYYNYREYSNGFVDHNFSTLGFGAEALMYDWSVRSNAFFAIDGRESNGRTAFPIPGGPDYVPEVGASMGVQNIRLATQTENFDEALDGFDLSISRKIYQARTELGAGVYYLSAGGGPNSWGVSGTAETWITSNISGSINVSNDSLFDTTVFGGVSMYFGGRNIDVDSRSHTVESRLWSRVQRRHVAPVLNYTTDAPDLLATDPGTGDLISVVQLGDMDDIVGAPGLMEADGDFVDIILADPDSTFAPTATIALNDGQRLLSGHIFHEVDTTEVGVIQLPETDLGGAAAFIENMVTGIDVITLANGNEVSGFMIQAGTLANGIAGADISGFDINRNIIPGAGSNGVSIDSSGIATLAGVFSDNTITGADLDGVVLIGNDIDVDFLFNTISSNGNDNVDIEAGGEYSGFIVGNTLNAATGGSGFEVSASTIAASFIDNAANENEFSGFDIVVNNTTPGFVLLLEDNTTNLNGLTNMTGGDGVSITFNGDDDSEVFIDDNTADGNDGDGIAVTYTGLGSLFGEIINNTTNGNDPGILVQSTNAAGDGIFVDIKGNLAGGNTQEGILVESASDFIGEVSGNTTSLNGGTGLAILADDNFGGLIDNNTAEMNGGSGIQVEADFDLSGAGAFVANVTNNTGNDNTGGEGILIGGFDIGSQITGNTANDNTALAGMRIAADGNIGGLIDDNTANGNAENGIEILADFDADNSGDVIANVTNNTAGVIGNGNGINGILITGENLFGNVTGNTAHANTEDGINIDVVNDIGTAMSAVLVDGNTAGVDGMIATGNGGFGIRIASGSDIFATINNNDAHHNDRGLTVVTPSGTITGDVTNNRANNNAMNGVHVTGLPLFTSFVGDVTGNTGNGNGLVGVRVDNLFDINSTLTGNTANGNLVGIFVEADNDFTGNFGDVMDAMLGNTANMNGDDGIFFDIGNDFTGDFANNSATGNSAFDYNTSAGGTVTGTVTPNTSTTNAAGDFNGNIATP